MHTKSIYETLGSRDALANLGINKVAMSINLPWVGRSAIRGAVRGALPGAAVGFVTAKPGERLSGAVEGGVAGAALGGIARGARNAYGQYKRPVKITGLLPAQSSARTIGDVIEGQIIP
jgi:hypothetical protein